MRFIPRPVRPGTEVTMRRVALAAAGLVTLAGPAFAQYYGPRPSVPIGPMPADSVFQMVRQMGLEPVGAPVRSGPVYFQRAGRLLRQAAARRDRRGPRAGCGGRAG